MIGPVGKAKSIAPLVAALLTSACAGSLPPLATVEHVDLDRFMGDWYVIANIPTFVERGAYNAVEKYALNEDGSIATTFTFRKGGFDGKQKMHTPTGFVTDRTSNAVWSMQFIWPIKADYRIVYLTDDYAQTIIARNQRDYVWIMARTPTIPDADYDKLTDLIADMGYDVGKLQKVPQRWQPGTTK